MPFDQAYLRGLGLKTGDVVFFNCDTVFSKLVKAATDSQWSHMGTIVVADDGTVNCFESALSVSLGQGVQINPLDQTLAENLIFSSLSGLAIRRLTKPLTLEQERILIGFINNQLGRPYEYNLVDLLKPAVFTPSTPKEMLQKLLPAEVHHHLEENEFCKVLSLTLTIALTKTVVAEDDKAFFCSELVTKSLQQLGLVDPAKADATYSPGDYADPGTNEPELRAGEIFAAMEVLPLPSRSQAALTIAHDAEQAARRAIAVVAGTAHATGNPVSVTDQSIKQSAPCCTIL